MSSRFFFELAWCGRDVRMGRMNAVLGEGMDEQYRAKRPRAFDSGWRPQYGSGQRRFETSLRALYKYG